MGFDFASTVIPPKKFSELGPFADVYRAINQVLNYAVATRPVGSGQIAARGTSFGTIVSAAIQNATAQSEPGTLQQYMVTAVHDDYLSCRKYDGGMTGDTVYIAKPHELRRAPWHLGSIRYTHEFSRTDFILEFTYTGVSSRTSTLKTSAGVLIVTENQAIIPRYIANQTIILAMECEQSLGITEQSGITKVDINSGGRSWVRLLS